MCRCCACSCKINSCIFKRDANESAWWTRLLAWNLITSVVPFADEFTFPSCLFLSFIFFLLLSFTLHVPCNTLCESMSWIQNLWHDSLRKRKGGGGPATPNTHLIFYTTKWLLFAEKRDREKNNKGLQLSALSDSGSPAPRYFHELKLEVLFLWGVTHLGPETERTACQPPLHHLRWPPLLPPPTPTSLMWPSFSTTLILCDCSLPRSDQLMQETWPLKQGQELSKVYQMLPFLAPLLVLLSLTPTSLS